MMVMFKWFGSCCSTGKSKRQTLSEGNIRLAASCLSGNTILTERNYENAPEQNLMRKYAEPYHDVFVM